MTGLPAKDFMIRKRALLLALALLSSVSSVTQAEQTMMRLRVEDGRVVNAADRPVMLHGVNLGNWLLFEPGAFNNAIGRVLDQARLFHVLRDRFGEAERRRLMDVYRSAWITERDFDDVKKFGFNFVRVGFDHEILEYASDPYVLRDDAFKYLDFAVQQARHRGVYVLFDLHGAPGSQHTNKATGDASRADFWKGADHQERAFWLWAKIAERYKDEPAVFAFEAINEPFSATDAQLADFCARFYDRVRAVAPQTILVMPGQLRKGVEGVQFYGDPQSRRWQNVMFDMHFYPGVVFSPNAKPSTVASASATLRQEWPGLGAYTRKIKTPLLVGELSVVYKSGGGGEMLRRYFDAADGYGWATAVWTLKELTPEGGVQPKMWMLTTNEQPLPKLDLYNSSKGEIEAFFQSLKSMPLVTDPDTLHWLTTPDAPAPLPADDQAR